MSEPGTLRDRLRATTARALRSGALQPIATRFEILADGGIRFLVRILEQLARKEAARGAGRKVSANPFLPYDPELFVAEISATHVCLLNKFNVVDEHALIVTREFEHQDELMNERDFHALWLCLAEIDGLAFYNGGTAAGASQPHKHLQIVPLPLAPGRELPPVPMEPLILQAAATEAVRSCTEFPFPNAVVRFERQRNRQPELAAQQSLAWYREMRQQLGLDAPGEPPRAYNLLLTRDWMFMVPRCCERFEGISLNSLAFAGALLVRDAEQLKILKCSGPMQALRHVTTRTP